MSNRFIDVLKTKDFKQHNTVDDLYIREPFEVVVSDHYAKVIVSDKIIASFIEPSSLYDFLTYLIRHAESVSNTRK